MCFPWDVARAVNRVGGWGVGQGVCAAAVRLYVHRAGYRAGGGAGSRHAAHARKKTSLILTRGFSYFL